jgi:hypothetical protein
LTDEFKQLLQRDWAKAAAAVVLTRRDDLTVVEAPDEPGLDLRVLIEREGEWTRPSFGVVVRAIPSSVTRGRANRLVGPTVAQFPGLRTYTCPVCLFVCTMRGEQEFFSWIDEPTLTDGGSNLVRHHTANCLPVTKDLLDQVVERVVAWRVAAEALI